MCMAASAWVKPYYLHSTGNVNVYRGEGLDWWARLTAVKYSWIYAGPDEAIISPIRRPQSKSAVPTTALTEAGQAAETCAHTDIHNTLRAGGGGGEEEEEV